MIRLVYDTETTGFLNPLDPPHIVQLAAILVDDELGEISSMNVIVKPTDWTVPQAASDVHGITTEKALAFGIPLQVALATFSQFCLVAEQAVAHNGDYDRQVIHGELVRLNKLNRLAEMDHFCTMKATTHICKIPDKRGRNKWPKLQEAHVHFFGEEFESAHDALADVRACWRVHKHLIDNNLI